MSRYLSSENSLFEESLIISPFSRTPKSLKFDNKNKFFVEISEILISIFFDKFCKNSLCFLFFVSNNLIILDASYFFPFIKILSFIFICKSLFFILFL